jgi:hypothetical protein
LTVLTLRFAVRCLDGEELLPANTPLSERGLRGLAGSGRGKAWPEVPLLHYATVRRDLLAYVRQGPYRVIFEDAAGLGTTLALMQETRLPIPLLDGLRRFRRHDPYTYRHFLMVFALSCLLARHLGHGFDELLREATAGPLHDIGKACIPLKLLKKSTPLKRSERALLEHHTHFGFALLSYYLGDPGAFAAIVARDHHERRDGSGYPRGIRLRDRLLEIVVACDVYDALISPRPYRKASFDNRAAIEQITAMAERGEIGWDTVTFLVADSRKDRPPPKECKVSLEKRGKPPEGNLYGIVLEDETPASSR